MANLEVPGWSRAMYLKDWDSLNRIVDRECRHAARNLEVAWGRGGSQGEKKVKQWDGWFSNLSHRIHDLSLDKKLYPDTENAALSACAEILALETVPHWDHVDDIQAIRTLLKPEQAWEDYPERGMGFDDDDDYM